MAADFAAACGITDLNIISSRLDGTNYANASYHGIVFQGRQDGTLYQWEVAFSGLTNTQLINRRTAVAAAPVLSFAAIAQGIEHTVGRPFSYNIVTLATAGPTSGTLTLTATLPAGQTFASSTGADWTCNAAGQVVTCTSATAIAVNTNGPPLSIFVTPTAVNSGFVQRFTLSGGGAAAAVNSDAASITVNAAPQTLVQLPSTTLTQGVLATPFTPVTRTSGGTAGFTWGVSPGLPAGLTLNATTGEVTGTPTSASASTSYTFTVTDARGATASGQANILVQTAQEIEVSASIGGAVTDGGTNAQGSRTVGTPVTVTYTVTNSGNANLTLATATASSPSLGLIVGNVTAPGTTTVAPSGTTTFAVTYTPTAAGAFSFNLSFVNNDSDENPFNFTISGTATAPAPVLGLTAIPSATAQTVGRSFTYTVTPSATVATAGPAPLTLEATFPTFWSASGASNADWTCSTATAGGTITVICTSTTTIAAGGNGTPVTITVHPASASGAYVQAFTLSGGGASAAANANAASVTVNGLPQTTATSAGEIIEVNVPVTPFTPVTRSTGGTTPFTWTVSPDLPTGLIYNSTTGRISGTPTVTSSATTYTYTVTDARGATSSKTSTLTVVPPAPTITSISPASGAEGGGTSVVIRGANFTGASLVRFGTTDATTFNVDSATQITAVAPAGTGAVDIRVSTAGGTSANTAADNFAYFIAPAISGLSPNSGPAAGGNSVVITGSNFTGATEVFFGGITALFSVDSATQITATAPSVTGVVDVVVRVAGVDSANTAADNYTYIPAPTINSISANSGPETGGTSVVITGTNFTGVTSVRFGTIAAVSLTIDSATQITAVSPAGTGTVDISVTTPGGISANTVRDNFTYIPAPAITSLIFGSAPETGGTSVFINGTNLTGATAVTFGTTPASRITSNTATQIVAEVPAGTGVVDISVTTPGGTNANTPADDFTYIPVPAITSISRSSGPLAGGTTVVITGTNFTGATEVVFNPSDLPGSVTFTVDSATQITAVSPPKHVFSPNTVNIAIKTPGGTSADTAADDFTYVFPPTISSISPSSGAEAGGTSVTITGTNLTNASAVNFGAAQVLATNFTSISATQIVLNSPAGTGAVDISVTTPGGTSTNTASDDFTYIPAPTITSISPNSGPAVGGTAVTITGTNLTNASAVNFGAAQVLAANFTSISATQIVLNSPAGTGAVDISVTTLGGTSTNTAADNFTYIAAPTITSISRSLGTTFGGTNLTITGTNLTNATKVTFGTTDVTSFTSATDTQITLVTPARTAGLVNVSVTTASGTSTDIGAGDNFTFVAPTLSINDITLAEGNSGNTAFNFTLSLNVPAPDVGTVSVNYATAGGTANAGDDFVAASGTASFVAGESTATVTVNVIGDTIFEPSEVFFVNLSSPQRATLSDNQGNGSITNDDAPPAPTIASISPSNGPTAGNTQVTITGTGFAAGATVNFGGAAGSNVVVTNSGLLTVTTPARLAGTVNVTVTSNGVASTEAGAADDFEYGSAPTILTNFLSVTHPYDHLGDGSGDVSGLFGGTVTGFYLGSTGTSTSLAIGGGTVTITPAGIVSFARPAGFRGAVAFFLRAFNAFGASHTVAFRFEIGNPTLVSTLTGAGAQQGNVMSGHSIQTSGGRAPYSCATTPATGSLPAGVTINADCTLSGMPTQSGTFDVTLDVTDSSVGPNGSAPYSQRSGTLSLSVAPPAPTITSISPSSGPAVGGTAVTITGTNLTNASAVNFGAAQVLAANFTSISATQIVLNSPVGTGAVDISVTTPGGTSTNTAADDFTYIAAPTITAVSPNSGPAVGGTAVTITGTNLTNASAVSFGTSQVLAANFTSISATQIVLNSPSGTGAVDISVTTPGGASTNTATDNFTYLLPPTATVEFLDTTIIGNGTDLARYRVTVTNPNAIALTGVTFSQSFPSELSWGGLGSTCTGYGTSASIGGYALLNGPLAANASCTVTVNLRSATPGTYNVTLASLSGGGSTGTLPTAATLTVTTPAPAITAISPNSGPAAGGTAVTITGTNLTNASAVSFGAAQVLAANFTSISATQIVLNSPAGTGTVDISVTTPGGNSANTAADDFTYIPAPTIASISPNSGSAAGGTSVVITGTNLTAASAVSFGVSAATSFTVDSATQITAVSPTGTGVKDIRVATAGGISVNTASDDFTYIPAPAIASISPANGPEAGGTSVVITGTTFTGATAVTFGTSAATSFTVNSATQITAVSPAGTGISDIRVTTASGTSANTASDDFTFVALPTIASISPTNGPTTGGTSVVITGTNLSAATGVAFGATAATSFTVNSATQITAVSPAGTGAVDISVTTAGGTSTNVAGDDFAYIPAPTIASISATNGPEAGGTSVVITGANLTGATAVRFGATAAASFTVNSASQITAISPAGTGAVDISVTTAGGTSTNTASDDFAYVALPTIASISPSSGAEAGGTSVVITGTNLSAATGVAFGATAATSFTVNSATQITAVSPAGTGAVDISVTTVGGTSANTAGDDFTYIPAPAITAINPNFGTVAGGTSVVITGANLTGATAVRFGANAAASFTVNSASQITAVSPAGMGVVDISISTAGGTNANTAGDDFAYIAAPTLTAFTHSSTVGYNAGGAGASSIDAATQGNATSSPTSYAITAPSANGAAVTVSTAGIVSYTPAVGFRGADTFGLSASNVIGTSAQVTVTVNVGDPTFTAILTGGAAVAGTPYTGTISISGGQAPYSAFGATGLPPGLNMDAATGTITGTPTASGNFATLIVTATDASTPAFTGSAAALSITVTGAAQTITFANPGPQPMGAGQRLVATASSGLAVTFSSLTPAICTITPAGDLTVVALGRCEIAADQAGDAATEAAARVTQSFAAGQAVQTITLVDPTPAPGQTTFLAGDQVTLTATASSGLAVVFTSLTPDICTVSPTGQVQLIKAGECRIAVDQPGTEAIAAAAQVIKTIQVLAPPSVLDSTFVSNETALITKMQSARARALVLNQPSLSALLEEVPEPSTSLSVSTKGADLNLIRGAGSSWLRMSGTMSRQEGGANSHYLQFSLGSHVKLGPNTILGLMGTFDSMRLNDPLGYTDGRGWLVGPYLVTKLGESALLFEARALTGRTQDSIAQTGQPASDVGGQRSMMIAKLSGSYTVNTKLTLSPSFSLATVQQTSDAYVTAGGAAIAGVTNSYRQQSVGLDWRYDTDNALGAQVFHGGIGWFTSQDSQIGRGQGLSYSLGYAQDFGENSKFKLDVFGERDFDNKIDRLGVSMLLQSKF